MNAKETAVDKIEKKSLWLKRFGWKPEGRRKSIV